jgi:FkbM family methyltransferase
VSFNDIFEEIKNSPDKHPRGCEDYKRIESKLLEIVNKSGFVSGGSGNNSFGPFGEISLPYFKMGAIDSLDLFGLDELIIFAFYWVNKLKYKKIADIGANIGLHSILMSKCNWVVNAYEPDPHHITVMKTNIEENQAENININQMAVSGFNGNAEFTRVLGNTTGSHLTGAKDKPYGDLEKFKVVVKDIQDIMPFSDLIKLDVEGEEANVITSTVSQNWNECDMMAEVGSESNAIAIFNHLSNLRINMFSQKIGWSKVKSLSQIPISYKEGSLFISKRESLPI